jgi:hypothetical protein
MQYSQVLKSGGAVQAPASIGSTSIDSSGVLTFAGRGYAVGFDATQSDNQGNPFQAAFSFQPTDGTSPTLNHWWIGKAGNALKLCDTSAPTSPTPTSHVLIPSTYEAVSFSQFVAGSSTTTYFHKLRNCAQVSTTPGVEQAQGNITPANGQFYDGAQLFGYSDVMEMMSDPGLLKNGQRLHLRLFRRLVNGTYYHLIVFWRDNVDGSLADPFMVGYQELPM